MQRKNCCFWSKTSSPSSIPLGYARSTCTASQPWSENLNFGHWMAMDGGISSYILGEKRRVLLTVRVRGTNHYCSLPLQCPDYRKTWFDTESVHFQAPSSGKGVTIGSVMVWWIDQANMDSLVAFHTVKAHKDMHTMHASAMFYATKCSDMSSTGIEVCNWCILISRSFTQHGLFCMVKNHKKSTWPLWPVTTKWAYNAFHELVQGAQNGRTTTQVLRNPKSAHFCGGLGSATTGAPESKVRIFIIVTDWWPGYKRIFE